MLENLDKDFRHSKWKSLIYQEYISTEMKCIYSENSTQVPREQKKSLKPSAFFQCFGSISF